MHDPINLVALSTCVIAAILGAIYVVLHPRMALLMVKNLGRSPVRTLLISLAVVVLVMMVTLIWTVIYFLDQTTTERSKDLKLIIMERWQIPSQMPMKHSDYLDPASPSQLVELKGKYTARDYMTWSFYVGYFDLNRKTPADMVGFFVMNPNHIKTMMDDLDTLDDALIDKLKKTRNGCLMGAERMAKMNKKVGERFKVYSLNYKGIDLDFEIVGELPEGRYNLSGIMRIDYFIDAFEAYERNTNTKHNMVYPDDRRLNLIWLRVPDRETFNEVGAAIETSPRLDMRPVRVDTASSAVALFLEAYRDLLWGMKVLLVPAILIIMSLVVAIAIAISVRERRTEIAVMKVLGYRPNQVLNLVIGESLLLGSISGLIAAVLIYTVVDFAMGGIKFPIAFFPAFLVPVWALAWGPAMGVICAFVGSFFPAWQARGVHVAEVFSRVE
jgi:putative ABC transport system permease protein